MRIEYDKEQVKERKERGQRQQRVAVLLSHMEKLINAAQAEGVDVDLITIQITPDEYKLLREFKYLSTPVLEMEEDAPSSSVRLHLSRGVTWIRYNVDHNLPEASKH